MPRPDPGGWPGGQRGQPEDVSGSSVLRVRMASQKVSWLFYTICYLCY